MTASHSHRYPIEVTFETIYMTDRCQVRRHVQKGDSRQTTLIAELNLRTPPGHGSPLTYDTYPVVDQRAQMASFASLLSVLGPQAPAQRSVLAACSGADATQTVSDRYGDVDATIDGQEIVSADALEIAILRRVAADQKTQSRIREVLSLREPLAGLEGIVLRQLVDEQRIVYVPAGRSDIRFPLNARDTIDLVLPYGSHSGYLSQNLDSGGLFFNGGFYVSWDGEFRDNYACAQDPAGLSLTNGHLDGIPAYRRMALLVGRDLTSDSWQAQVLPTSLDNWSALFTGSILISTRPALDRRSRSVGVSTVRAEYCRTVEQFDTDVPLIVNQMSDFRRSGSTLVATPATQRLELVVTGKGVVSLSRAGSTSTPVNGVIVSLPRSSAAAVAIEHFYEATGSIPCDQAFNVPSDTFRPRFGIQVGPMLMRNSRMLNIARRTARQIEEYLSMSDDPNGHGIPPVYLQTSTLAEKRHARLAVGLKSPQDLVVGFFEGCEDRSRRRGIDSEGVTLDHVADTLRDAGCRDAVCLDSGGSALMALRTDPLGTVADRNEIIGVPQERLLPGQWRFSL
jgi:Phosphodiester glycosidase